MNNVSNIISNKENNYNPAKVIILTGFFGSGKTTLIKNLTNDKQIHSSELAIIQNEFSSEMGIESDMLTDGEGKSLGNLIEMPSGCMCCVVRDNTVLFLQKLLKTKPNIKYIIIECHGMAEVDKIIKRFWVDDSLELGLTYYKTLCLVDAYNYEKSKKEHFDIFNHQIVSSDIILLNKIDLIEKCTEYIKIKHQIKKELLILNPLCEILESKFSELDIKSLFFDQYNNINIDEKLDKIKELKQLNIENTSTCSDHYYKNENIEYIIIKLKSANSDDIEKSTGLLLWDLSEKLNFNVIRLKGIIKQEDGKVYSLQGIYDTYEIIESNFNQKCTETKESKILIIGKNITKNKKEIQLIYENLK